jgi:hypothetical protein
VEDVARDMLPKSWVDVAGRWAFPSSEVTEKKIVYSGTDVKPVEYGLCLNDGRVLQGRISTTVVFPNAVTEAKVVFGYDSELSRYYMAGLGGWGNGYTISEFVPSFGWRGLKVAGRQANIVSKKEYVLEVRIQGHRIVLAVDGVRILEHVLEAPLAGDQIGLFAVGQEVVEFRECRFRSEPADIFVIMQYTEPYESLYKEVIEPVCEEFHLHAIRADNMFSDKGIVLQDIIQGIIDSRIIVAEITPENANVYYELGYAHALQKSTILLAEKGYPLPFDIQGYRTIFYEDTIRGKNEVEENLRRYLDAIAKPDK